MAISRCSGAGLPACLFAAARREARRPAPLMHRRGDDPGDAEGHRGGHNGGGHIALLNDGFAHVESRGPRGNRQRDHERHQAQAGEEDRVEYGGTGHRRPSSQARQPSKPCPLVQETSTISISGCTRRAFSQARAAWNGTYGSRSILFRTIKSAWWNVAGYLSGLSSPSVTLSSTARASSPRS